jgi:L-threonylcarbamoyladenylate synthase
LTLVLPLKSKNPGLKLLSARTETMGIRMPDNRFALNLVRKFKKPITTTSANPSSRKLGGFAPYSVTDSFKQFAGKKNQPDLYVDSGGLPKRLPSTMIQIEKNKIKFLRRGPVTKTQILNAI